MDWKDGVNLMPESPLPTIPEPSCRRKPRRQDLRPDEILCDHCGAKCCRYFALPIDKPKQWAEFDYIRWYLLHEGAAVFTEEGRAEAQKVISFYLDNAKIIADGLSKLGIKYSGGKNSPYIWLKTPKGLGSWEFFNKLLEECQVVGTPGVGFGKCGEGYFRLTAFGQRENIVEAVGRLNKLNV